MDTVMLVTPEGTVQVEVAPVKLKVELTVELGLPGPKICHVDVLFCTSIARACQWYPPFGPVKEVVATFPGATNGLDVTFGTFVNAVLDGSSSTWSCTLRPVHEFNVAPKTTVDLFVELPSL